MISRSSSALNAMQSAIGHRLEVRVGKHRLQRMLPPRIPKHPLLDLERNLNELTTYADLKLRWQQTSHTPISRNRLKLRRKWSVEPNWAPRDEPSVAFVRHSRMPHSVGAAGSVPLASEFKPADDLFCVFKSTPRLQHKVVVGDLVQTERIKRKEAGERVSFGTVLLVGSKEWSMIGKPTVQCARVHCTVEQQTLSKEMLVYMYKARRRVSRFKRVRQWVTMLRVDAIEVDPEFDSREKVTPGSVRPVRLLDLWANRWMTAAELKHVKRDSSGAACADAHYSGGEHKPGAYQKRGLDPDYRFPPDNRAPDNQTR